MARQYVQDMTSGNETSLLLKFSLPMLIGNIFQQFYNMVDSIVVGNYVGKEALAAVGMTASLNFLYFSLCNGFATGAGVLISQYFGMKNERRVKDSIGNSLYLMLGMGILMSVVSVLLSAPILRLLNTPENIFQDALLYTRIVCGGLFSVVLYNGIAAMLRALGDSTTPLIFLVLSSILNIIGDLVLVLVFHMGVAGVAIATIAAQLLSALGCIAYAVLKNPYFRLKKENFRISSSLQSKMLRLGIPFGAQGSLIAFSCVALQSVINRFGSDVIAAFTATNRIEQLVQQPFNSLGTALATFTGQNLGAGNVDRVRTGYKRSCLLVVIFSLLMCAMMFIWGEDFVGLFVDDASVIAIGGRAVQITSLFYIPLGMIYIARSLLNGSGDSVFAFISGLAEVAGRIGFSIGLSAIPALGYWAVWYTTGLTWLITGIVCMLRYAQGKWKKIVLTD
ncbi:MAG TPA: MATE family efflux transporter [Candidatus Choladousia intestinigallinarum]|nr:MATE family efflux transporter [Candidatus Choladousia intestinigallinarum]